MSNNESFRNEIAKQIKDHISSLFQELFVKFPTIKDSITFGCGDTDGKNRYHYYTWTDSFLEVDGISVYPENEEEEEKHTSLSEYFESLKASIDEIFEGDFPKLFVAWQFLTQEKFDPYSNVMIVKKDGSWNFT